MLLSLIGAFPSPHSGSAFSILDLADFFLAGLPPTDMCLFADCFLFFFSFYGVGWIILSGGSCNFEFSSVFFFSSLAVFWVVANVTYGAASFL